MANEPNKYIYGPKPYWFVKAWGKQMGSFQYYIDRQVELAREEGAPHNAIYRDTEGTWHTVNDVKDESTRDRLRRDVQRMMHADTPEHRREANSGY